MTWTLFSFVAFTAFVALYAWYRLRREALDTADGFFLGGRSLSGLVIAGSMLLTNISTEHLIGMNGSSYKNGFVIIAWEVTSALALVIGATYFVPKYLKMGLTTIPQYLEYRFDGATRTLVALFLIVSFVVTLLPIVLYTGAINFESIFGISELLGVNQQQGLWITVVGIGLIGSLYAIVGGLKAVAISDNVNGYGLLLGGLLVPLFALLEIGEQDLLLGLERVYEFAPEKFNVIGSRDSVLPFETLFTGLIINQLYFWCMNQAIIQRALGARNLAEAQKGLLLAGAYKLLIPLVIILPGVIAYYYFQDGLYDTQDSVYPELVKRVLPHWMVGFFAAVVMGAVLSTFNSVLNSAATLFSVGIYQRHLHKNASERQLVRVGKGTSTLLALLAIGAAPWVANAPEGLYQLLQQLNGIFFIPIASILLAGFFWKKVSVLGAKVALFVGLAFYLLMSFVFDTSIHFVHVWGMEFLLNLLVMGVVSHWVPHEASEDDEPQAHAVSMKPWKYTPAVAWSLTLITLLIYLLLS